MALLGALFLVIALEIVSPIKYADNDFFTFWLSGRLVATGQNPYDASVWTGAHHQFGATWIPNETFVYPLPLSLLFVPLGLLPVYPAYVLWVALSEFMIVMAGTLLLRLHPWSISRYFALPLLLGVAAFRPTMLSLLNGQLTSLVLLMIACLAYLWSCGKWRQGALLLPLLSLKPNLGVPIIAMLSLYLLLRRQFAALLCEAAAGLALIVVGMLQNLHWISQYISIGSNKVEANFILSPTVWGMSGYLCRLDYRCAIPPAVVGVLALITAYIAFLIRFRGALSPAWAIGLSAAIMLLITPYTWQYDQLLLLVLIIEITMSLAGAGIPFLANALIFVGIDIFAFVLLWVSGQTGFGMWNVFIPVCVLGLAAWAISRERRKSPSMESGPIAVQR